MLAECADEQWGTTSNIVLYHLLHGFETEKRIPKKTDSLFAKRRRDGSAILPSSATTRYMKHRFSYEGFYFDDDTTLVKELHASGIDVKVLLPYEVFVSYIRELRKLKAEINAELKVNDAHWYGNTERRIELWVRLYALCVGVTTPYTQLHEPQKNEFIDRFTTTFNNRLLYAGISNLLNAGLGLFARTTLKKGTFLGEFKGKWYSIADYLKNKHTFPLQWTIRGLDKTQLFVPDPSCILSQANDSSYENTKFLPNNTWKDKNKKDINATMELDGLNKQAVVLILTKDVDKGDEIFFKYGDEYKF
jgi:hypothetical protein